MSQAAFAAGEPRLFARPFVRDALGVRRFAAFARDLAALGSIQECETSEMFCGHGTLVCLDVDLSSPDASPATVACRRSPAALSPRIRSRPDPRALTDLQMKRRRSGWKLLAHGPCRARGAANLCDSLTGR